MGLLAGGFFTSGEGGDIIDLQGASGSESTSGSSASGSVYAVEAGDGDAGEVWFTDEGEDIYGYDLITPKSNIGNYQMKWDALAGDPPNSTSSAEGVWQSLLTNDFRLTWSVSGGPDLIDGSATVSIRLGAGPSVLQTAIWSGDAELSGKGK
jgi:hypothetical protein